MIRKAFVTKQRRERVSTVIGLTLLAAAALVYYANRPKLQPVKIKARGVCVACGQDALADTKPMTPPPWMCPRCGAQAVYSWQYCPKCKKLFAPKLIAAETSGAERPDQVQVCPGCGNEGTVGYDPNAGQEVTGQYPVSTRPAFGPASVPASQPRP